MNFADTIPPGRWQKVRGLVYRVVPEGVISPWWMGRGYREVTGERVMILIPLHWVAHAWGFAAWHWNHLRVRPSWVDERVRRGYNKGLEEGDKAWRDQLKKAPF